MIKLGEYLYLMSHGNPKGYDVIFEMDGESTVLASFATPGSAFEYMATEKEALRVQGVLDLPGTAICVKEKD